MRNARHTLLVLLGMLVSSSAYADAARENRSDAKLSSVVALYVQALNSDPGHASRWQPFYRLENSTFAETASRPVVNVNFNDNGALARVRKIRALSLLTLAEVKGARVFLGVNRKGLIGLHIRAVAPYGDQSYLEFARMPYLHESGPLARAR